MSEVSEVGEFRSYTTIRGDLFVVDPRWYTGEVEDYWLRLAPVETKQQIAQLLQVHAATIGFTGKWRCV